MKIPFTREQFLEVFRKYNTAVYPLQIVFLILAAYVIFLFIRHSRNSGKTVTVILAALWFWMGAAYQIVFFSVINKAAYVFGALFILQSILLLFYGLIKAPLFTFHKNKHSITSRFTFGLCTNHIPTNRIFCRARLPLLTDIWFAMPHNYFHSCYMSISPTAITVLHHINTVSMVNHWFFGCI
jgi:hypothetical protein